MWVLLPNSALEFANYTTPYREMFWPWVERMAEEIRAKTFVGAYPEFIRTFYNIQTPMRMMEYSFALRCLLDLSRTGMQPARILDAGCGFTPFSCCVADSFGADVTAVDSDPAATEVMRQFGGGLGGLVKWEPGDLTDLQFPDEHFDVIFCMSVLEHIPRGRDSRAVREMLRLLRPGGVLVITVDWGPSSFRENALRFMRRLRSAVNAMRRGGVKEAFQRAMAPKPYTTRSLLRYVVGVQPVSYIGNFRCSYRHLPKVTTRDIVAFWVQYSVEDMPYNPQRKYYAAVGLLAAKDEIHRREIEKHIDVMSILP